MIINRRTIGQPKEPEMPPDELEAMVQARMLALQGLEAPPQPVIDEVMP